MPIDDLTALGQKMREARKNKELTQQELSDLSHVSVKQIANIEQGKTNSSYLILRALAKVLHISLDTLSARNARHPVASHTSYTLEGNWQTGQSYSSLLIFAFSLSAQLVK